MKRLLILFFLFSTLVVSVSAHSTGQEHIAVFNSEISVNKDGTLDVIEKISYDFGTSYKHGIFREIPYIKTNAEGKKFKLDVKVLAVTDQTDKDYRFETSKTNKSIQLKIGHPDRTITGSHLYQISYKVSGALTYFQDHDELYWNITGNEWPVPIELATTSVSYPKEIELSRIQLRCFTGPSGSRSSDCSYELKDEKASSTANQTLNPEEGLTIVFGFPKGYVSTLEPVPFVTFLQTWYGKILTQIFIWLLITLAIFWYILYPLWIIFKWYKYGRDPKVPEGPVSAWFDAPKTKEGHQLTPAETGTLIDERASFREVISIIVDLARRGLIKIEERKKNDFYLIKSKEFKNDTSLLSFEKMLLEGIFDKGEREVSLDKKNLFHVFEQAQFNLYNSLVTEGFFPKSPKRIRDFYIIIFVLSMFSANFFLAVVSLLFGLNMPSKTALGASAANMAKSLKNFLSSQERQLEFQAKNQMFFEKLLPYAIAFGVEKQWVEKFKGVKIAPPEWYSSSSGSLDFRRMSFSKVFMTHVKSYATSSSGFSSGFSGGGSSGGGGGGGGGSW